MYAARKAAEARVRGDESAAKRWEGIAAVVDQAPPLTQAQRDQLAVLLRPSGPTPARSEGLRDAA